MELAVVVSYDRDLLTKQDTTRVQAHRSLNNICVFVCGSEKNFLNLDRKISKLGVNLIA